MTVQMAAPGSQTPPQCTHLALQTVHVLDPWPDTLVTTVRRLPSPPKEQGSPHSVTSYIVPPCRTRIIFIR